MLALSLSLFVHHSSQIRATIKEAVEKHAKEATQYNTQLLIVRRRERDAYYNNITQTMQYPSRRLAVLQPLGKLSAYPVAVMPMQHADSVIP